MAPNGEREMPLPWDAARINLTSKELAPGVIAVMPDDVRPSVTGRSISRKIGAS